MLTYLSAVLNLPQRQRGLTTVEYAIAGALIVIIIVAALKVLGPSAANTLNNVASNVQ